MPDGEPASTKLVITVVAAYIALNLGLNFWNKIILGRNGSIHFTYPIFYTACHQVASFGCAELLFRLVPSTDTRSYAQWEKFRVWILVLGCLFVVNIGANNMSLVYIGLSINSIVKSITPLPTMILSFLIEGKRYSLAVAATVVSMVGAAILSVPFGDEDNANMFGLVLVTLSMLAAATRPVMSAILMSDARQNGLTPLVLVWYDAAISSVLMFTTSVAMGEFSHVIRYMSGQPWLSVAIILIGSSMAFLYNIVLFKLCDVCGSLTTAVLGNAKQVLLITISVIFIDHISRFTSILGIVIFSLLSAFYTYLNIMEKREAAAAGGGIPQKSGGGIEAGSTNGSSSANGHKGAGTPDGRTGERAPLVPGKG